MTFIFDCQTSCWPWIDEALNHRNAVVKSMCLHKSGLIVLLFWGHKQQNKQGPLDKAKVAWQAFVCALLSPQKLSMLILPLGFLSITNCFS